MRARTRTRSDPQNLDSLLDTMANVTGILVVLLAVTQISVGDAVGRLRDALVKRPELSREAVLATENEAARLRKALAPLLPGAEQQEALRTQRHSELSGLRTRIASLERDLAGTRDAPRSEAELASRLADAKSRAGELERAIAAEQRAAAAAVHELASLPERALTRDLRLPDPRPPPAGATQVVYFCRYGRIFRVDGGDMLRRLWDGVNRATGGTTPERLRDSSLDRIRVIEYFQRHDVGSRDLRWHVLESGPELLAQLEWRKPEIGETREQIASGLSSYRGALLRYSPESVYFNYFVWDDSFDVYVAARELADEAGFSAGWKPFDAPTPFRYPLTQLEQGTLID